MSPVRLFTSRIIRLVCTTGLILALAAGLFAVLFFRPAAPALAKSPTLALPVQNEMPSAVEFASGYRVRESRAAAILERQRLPLAAVGPFEASAFAPDDFASRRQLQANTPSFAAVRQQGRARIKFAALGW